MNSNGFTEWEQDNADTLMERFEESTQKKWKCLYSVEDLPEGYTFAVLQQDEAGYMRKFEPAVNELVEVILRHPLLLEQHFGNIAKFALEQARDHRREVYVKLKKKGMI